MPSAGSRESAKHTCAHSPELTAHVMQRECQPGLRRDFRFLRCFFLFFRVAHCEMRRHATCVGLGPELCLYRPPPPLHLAPSRTFAATVPIPLIAISNFVTPLPPCDFNPRINLFPDEPSGERIYLYRFSLLIFYLLQRTCGEKYFVVARSRSCTERGAQADQLADGKN
jgi:hypothetical protein